MNCLKVGNAAFIKSDYMLEPPSIQQYQNGNNLLVRTISRQPAQAESPQRLYVRIDLSRQNEKR